MDSGLVILVASVCMVCARLLFDNGLVGIVICEMARTLGPEIDSA